MMKFSKTVAVTGLGAFLLLFAVACGETTTTMPDEVVPMPKPEMPAPADMGMDMTPSMPEPEPMHEISGSTFAGQTYSLASTAGKPAVLNFWFPSCDPCRANLTDFQSAYEEYGDRVEFIGIFNPTVDSEQQAMNLLDELGITYPNLTDTDFKFALNYEVAVSPTTFFVSRDHQTARRHSGGPIPYETLVANIEELLNPQLVQPTTPTPPVQPTTLNPSSFSGTGIYTVGIDIQPGIYVSTNRPPLIAGQGCTWRRQESSGLVEVGPLEALRASGVYEAYVDIEPSDIAFQSANCGTWRFVSESNAPPSMIEPMPAEIITPPPPITNDSQAEFLLTPIAVNSGGDELSEGYLDGYLRADWDDLVNYYNDEVDLLDIIKSLNGINEPCEDGFDASCSFFVTRFGGDSYYVAWISPDNPLMRSRNPLNKIILSDGSSLEARRENIPLNSDLPILIKPKLTDDSSGNYKIAFSSNRGGAGGNMEIFVISSDGSDETRLTFNDSDDSNPSWSPDGSKIAFQSNDDGDWEIFVMDADGSNQIQITSNEFKDEAPAWSPDGSKIAFQSDRDGDWEIFVMDADGSNQFNITNNEYGDWSPAWSPDGSKIAFTSYPEGQGGLEIFVISNNGSNRTRLDYGRDSSWSPDGSKIVFSSSGGEILVMDANGSNRTGLDLIGENPSWSPDGSKIAYKDGSLGIFTANPNGLDQNQLTFSRSDEYPSWSP